jgi:hypothetical protein
MLSSRDPPQLCLPYPPVACAWQVRAQGTVDALRARTGVDVAVVDVNDLRKCQILAVRPHSRSTPRKQPLSTRSGVAPQGGQGVRRDEGMDGEVGVEEGSELDPQEGSAVLECRHPGRLKPLRFPCRHPGGSTPKH